MGTNTGLGIGIGIPFKNFSSGGRQPLPPDLKASLKGVWIAYGKSNNDADRSIVKNLVDASNPFIISNAAYDKMSSYGGYEFAKFDNTLDWYNTEGNDSVEVVSRNGHSITLKRLTGPNFWYFQNSTFRGLISNVIPFKVNSNKNITVIWDVHGLSISEGKDKSVRVQELVLNPNEDNYTNLKTLNEEELAQIDISTNSLYYVLWFDLSTLAVDEEVTIEMLPLFEGAFVTDGIDDLITSTKTVQEMGITDEITVVSMIHKISSDNNWTNLIGELKEDHTFVANRATNSDKTGIYGYTYNYNENAIVINNILGDKNDYIVKTSTSLGLDNKYYVTGFRSAGIIQNISQIAWYWTFIANRVLTTDEINQVIAYFNLDRTLKPDILCNITKQGITNDNHADFNDKLIDYSGNGRDIQMYNLAWKGGSGVAAKKFETIKDYLIVPDEGLQELTIYNEFSYKVKSIKHADRYWTVQSLNKTDVSYPITIIADKDIIWKNILNYTDENGVKGNIKKETNVPANVPTQIQVLGFNDFDVPDNYTKVNCVSHATRADITEFTVTFIPSYKGGILLDGINDFGQFVGDLGLKDYTLIMNRAYNNLINNQVPLISSNIVEDQTPFIVEHWNTGSNAVSFSYGASCTTDIPLDINKKIVYQSTYSYIGYVIPKGNAISTGNGITLGKFGNGVKYSAICLWSLMLFPYSMSEFLIERQLKKHKLGTLYPDMMEFRPVIKTNVDYTLIQFYINNYTKRIYPGDYIPINTPIEVNFYLKNNVDELISFKVNGNDSTFKRSTLVDNAYNIRTLPITKSPQKIDITIDEYIRYEDIVQPYPVLLRFKDQTLQQVSPQQTAKVSVWDLIDAEIEPLTNEQRSMLSTNEE